MASVKLKIKWSELLQGSAAIDNPYNEVFQAFRILFREKKQHLAIEAILDGLIKSTIAFTSCVIYKKKEKKNSNSY